MAQVKCQICGEKDDKEKMVVKVVGKKTKSNKYYHEECLKAKEEAKAKDNPPDEYRELVGYICSLFGTDRPSMYILKQIKTYHTEYGYRYASIRLALIYFFEIKNNKIPEKQTIGIVPYIMDDTIEFYRGLAKVDAQTMEENDRLQMNIKPKKVNRHKRRIDMNDL